MAQIVCNDLNLGYEGKVVVKNLNFKIHEGEYWCIVGENGSGKSTLMKTLLKLHKPLSGKVSGLKPNTTGYLPQQTEVQKDFPASVEEVVFSGFLSRSGMCPVLTKTEKKKANDILKRLNALELKGRCYRELSGGQQQRVLLARALCATDKLLVLDEPMSGLDPQASGDMYEVIEEVNRRDGVTVLMVTHDVTVAVDYATHILHLGDGELLFCGTKDDYLSSVIGNRYLSDKVYPSDGLSAAGLRTDLQAGVEVFKGSVSKVVEYLREMEKSESPAEQIQLANVVLNLLKQTIGYIHSGTQIYTQFLLVYILGAVSERSKQFNLDESNRLFTFAQIDLVCEALEVCRLFEVNKIVFNVFVEKFNAGGLDLIAVGKE